MIYLFAEFSKPHFYLAVASSILLIVAYFTFRSKHIYLVDFVCYRPPDHLRVTLANFVEHYEDYKFDHRDSIDFQAKVLEKSGIGDQACVPLPVHELPPNTSLKLAREEVEEVLFSIVGTLLSKKKINPKSIDILVSNCSLFCPTPSITAMIINKFGFRSNVKSVSLSGMGCSAGILAINLAKDLLKVQKNSLALVLSMEAVSPNGYLGRNKSMLIGNTIFRMGGAAILLSNRKQDMKIAKYELMHLIRTHVGSNDEAYSSVIQMPDQDGFVGVSLSRALVHVASKALTINMSELGPLVLPYSEQLRFAWSVVCRKVMQTASRKKEVYVPNFKKAFDHFCIHAGGRAVIDAMESNLKLQKEDAEASRMTLYRFGNTSSSSVWYELCYLEAKKKLKKGDKIWQIAFGSGFKTNSAVWKCISDIDLEEENAWFDRINSYPVDTDSIFAEVNALYVYMAVILLTLSRERLLIDEFRKCHLDHLVDAIKSNLKLRKEDAQQSYIAERKSCRNPKLKSLVLKIPALVDKFSAISQGYIITGQLCKQVPMAVVSIMRSSFPCPRNSR
ncbi:hypothetical protein ACFE04_023774 [Oxalis oulophora]